MSKSKRDKAREKDYRVAELMGYAERVTVYSHADREERANPVRGFLRWPKSDMGNDRTWWTADGTKIEPGAVLVNVPRFTEDVADDYTVLEHVRKAWAPAKLAAFADHLALILDARRTDALTGSCPGIWAVNYRPGDYSDAALATDAGL